MSAANHQARASRRLRHAAPAKTWWVATCMTCLVERPARENGVVLPHPKTREPFAWCRGYDAQMGLNKRQGRRGVQEDVAWMAARGPDLSCVWRRSWPRWVPLRVGAGGGCSWQVAGADGVRIACALRSMTE